MKKTAWFTGGAFLILLVGSLAFQTMYQTTDFTLHHLFGDENLVQNRTIQLQYSTKGADISVDIVHGKSNKTISHTAAYTNVSNNYENLLFDETDAGEWKESSNYSATDGAKQMERIIHKAKVTYDVMFDNSTKNYHLDTGLLDYSNEEYEIKQTQMKLQGEPDAVNDQPMRIDQENVQRDCLQNLAMYCEDVYYFVPKTSSHMKGNVYLYRFIIKAETIECEKVTKLDHTGDIMGCYIIENRVLVLSRDKKNFCFTLYDTTGRKVKETTISPAKLDMSAVFTNDQYLIWCHDQMAYVLDCNTMRLITTETLQIDESMYQDFVQPALTYQDDMLWISGMKSSIGSYRNASIVAQRNNKILYEGEVSYITKGWDHSYQSNGCNITSVIVM